MNEITAIEIQEAVDDEHRIFIKMSHWLEHMLFMPLEIKDGALIGEALNKKDGTLTKVMFEPGWEAREWELVYDPPTIR